MEVIRISARFNFNIPDELLDRIKKLAAKSGYNTTEYIQIVLRQHADGLRFDELEKRVAELEATTKK